ncbi:MAG TPA: 1-(5-phosphoribosyl)-5-[(5-phosphoribosylamino)methylideneamino]imidazole-4-carboxamide isomerase [Chthonomonadaceae bacterium]|nr:1-(5-phosphoribosyl)-5-[(5-phosphoribosylamino)methylideneamino]imidazole-4-carboxamide isomerase [Chthonomonadaceae bacterium]
MILYPAIDLKGGKCVRLSQGDFAQVTTYSEDPLQVARRWKAEGAAWLHVVDLDGARTGLPNTANLEVVREVVRQVGVPVQFGGGARSAEIVERLLNVGVARVVVGTAVATDPALAEGLFTAYGEKVAVGVDAKDGFVAIQGWVESIGEQATAFVARMARLGARRFIFTDIARDGMLTGVNVVSLAQVAAAVPELPVIASGGVASIADLDALKRLRLDSAPNLEGVIVGKALYAGAVSLPDALTRLI